MSAEPVEAVASVAPPVVGRVGAGRVGTVREAAGQRPSLVRLPGCYPVQADTWLLADTMRDLGLVSGASVLDLCTGTGVLAVTAANAGAARVTAVDISVRSAANAWLNAKRHNAAVRVLRGDLFAALAPGEQFDLVVSNPPYVPSRTARLPRHTVNRCWDGGLDGRLLLDRICTESFDRVRPGGSLLLVHSTVAGDTRSIERLEESGFDVEVVRRAREPFGPVMRSRATAMRSRGLIGEGQAHEELVVIRATRVETHGHSRIGSSS